MVIDSRQSDALRRLVQNGSSVSTHLDRLSGFTLPGLIEVIASATAATRDQQFLSELRCYLSAHQDSPLNEGLECWQSNSSPLFSPDMHGIRKIEFYRLRERGDQTSDVYQLFQERFVRSLKANSFPGIFANALAGVMVEMTDNVIQHSRASGDKYEGLAAYHVEPDYMAIAVMDVGQGVLESLTRSPVWGYLKTSEQALRAAVIDHASCRPGQPEGEGFRTVLKRLAERNCRMRFRSGDAALRIEEVAGVHDGAIAISPSLLGLQLSICCALRGPPNERPIN
jgi:hypothetical protein